MDVIVKRANDLIKCLFSDKGLGEKPIGTRVHINKIFALCI